MRLALRPFLAVLLCLFALFPLHADEPLPRLLLISIDGLMPSRYTSPGPAKLPTLRRLMGEGLYADGVVGVLPSSTYPSHTTLITGVPPAVHGIYDNRILDPEGRANGAWYWYSRAIKVQSLATTAHARGLRVGAISWPVSVGLDIDYNVPEFWRSNHPETITLLRALSTPRNIIDAAEIWRGKPFEWPQNDRHRAEFARFLIRTYQPELLMVHLFDTDSAQHTYGPQSTEALEAHEQVDGYVGQILGALDDAGLADRTNVAIVSDHGFLPTARLLQVNSAFKDAGLLTVDASGAITEWRAYCHSSGGSAFIYLKNPDDAALARQVKLLLETLQGDPANGIRNIYTRDDLAQVGSHPDANFAIDMVDGFYTANGTNALLGTPADKGGHGFDPTRRALHASFIARGPAFARRGSVGIVRMTQIAPTLARILGVGLAPQADTPIDVAGGRTKDDK
jgi:predicted AlkP superfamily pyrophosphatase or phosphodiesterase